MTVGQESPMVVGAHGGIIGIYKPPGWPIHRTSDGGPNVAEWVAAHPRFSGLQLAHRLDKPVSGIVLGAVESGPLRTLGTWFEQGVVDKQYLALVHGHTREKGVIRRPLKDARRGRALEAITRYRRLLTVPQYSLLLVRIITGRKHQIRRHLEGIGHPIVGDRRYRGRHRATDVFGEGIGLHAWRVYLPSGIGWHAQMGPALAAFFDSIGLSEGVDRLDLFPYKGHAIVSADDRRGTPGNGRLDGGSQGET
ncbi:MAG: RNA pseudouridine synthase [Myxococcota bacterium]|nr:RNA pseudouridine synthase [Myxococcota bacterium]